MSASAVCASEDASILSDDADATNDVDVVDDMDDADDADGEEDVDDVDDVDDVNGTDGEEDVDDEDYGDDINDNDTMVVLQYGEINDEASVEASAAHTTQAALDNHATGNPILVLLAALAIIGIAPLRKK